METTFTNQYTPITATYFSSILKRILVAIVMIAGSATLSSAITISGTVYDDGDGGIINGTPISSIPAGPLYVYLIDNSGTVIDRSTISSTTYTYSLTGASFTNYAVALSSTFYAINSINPIVGLPSSMWQPTAEGVTTAGDGVPDYSVAISSGTNLTVNFAIDARPIGNSFYYSSPTFDANNRVTFPVEAFTGSDREDGTYNAGMYGRPIDLFKATGGDLYYNGALITFLSASRATRISSFDVSLLTFKALAGTAHQFSFALVDDAGVPEYVPNSITMPGSALPIDITTFSGTVRDQDNLLMWQTATEINNGGFIVERSDDGIHFRNVATVASLGKEGNSTQPLSYNYIDRNANTSAVAAYYYRIRQTDHSGAFAYTPVVRLANKNAKTMQLSVSPNPSSGTLNLDMATGAGTSETMNVSVVNATGNIVMNRSFDAQGGRLSTALDMTSFPAGTYYVQLRSASAPAQVQPFVLLPR